ncbi:MAG: type II secretion system protein [Planctomycetota bacterium]|nr:type II secretion system protein [Planctomycetota bacterium]
MAALSGRARSGFTLLELVLAVTVLASMTTLLAALWAQTLTWARDAGTQQRGLHLPRVLDIMRQQWSDRRQLRDGDPGVALAADSVEFLTATPLLHPEWPLATVRYRIERDRSTPGAGPLFRLVYEERPLADLSAAGGAGSAIDAEQNGSGGLQTPPMSRHVLLERCPLLVFERYAPTIVENGVAREREEEPGDELLKRQKAEQSKNKGQRADAPRRDDPFEGISRDPRDDPRALQASRESWWPVIDKLPREPDAMRLVGIFQEQEFTCVLVVKALRSF